MPTFALRPTHLPHPYLARASPLQGGYQVFLDHRVLRTPARHPLIVPSKALAMAVAAEWEYQVRGWGWVAALHPPFAICLWTRGACRLWLPVISHSLPPACRSSSASSPLPCR